MIPVIISADRETLEGVVKLVQNQIDNWNFHSSPLNPKTVGAISFVEQIQKQLDDSNLVCPIEKLAFSHVQLKK